MTGVVLNIGHSLDKLSVWFRHANSQETINQVRKDLVRIMALPADAKLEY